MMNNKKLIIIGIVVVLLLAAVFILTRGPAPEQPIDEEGKLTRTYSMGFSFLLPPTPDMDDTLKRFEIWSKRADGSITHIDVPWESLINGVTAEEVVREELLPRMTVMRNSGINDNIVTIEPFNGVNRMSEAEALVKANRSITEPEIQELYVEYASAVAEIIEPKYLGLAAEVNLIDFTLPPETYDALVKMTNDAAIEIEKNNPEIPLYVSFQVEAAWGITNNGNYVGIEKYFEDFSFIDVVGLASYPYQISKNPENIPDNYFTRLTEEYPLIISETGWPSEYSEIETSEEIQAKWIKRLGELADNSDVKFIGYMLFSDVDSSIPQEEIQQFATQGLVYDNFKGKPSLKEWDKIHKKELKQID